MVLLAHWELTGSTMWDTSPDSLSLSGETSPIEGNGVKRLLSRVTSFPEALAVNIPTQTKRCNSNKSIYWNN